MATRATRATVREWHGDEGWGVLDSPETPGGCWTHFSHVAVEGYRSLTAGQPVLLEWEEADQDGLAYRAVRTWPVGVAPAGPPVATEVPGAFGSTLTVTWEDEGQA